MTKIERTPDRLALQSGSTSIVLDKKAGEAVLQRKVLFWERKPVTRPLNSIRRVTVDTKVDPASKAEICSIMLLMREGGGWALPPAPPSFCNGFHPLESSPAHTSGSRKPC